MIAAHRLVGVVGPRPRINFLSGGSSVFLLCPDVQAIRHVWLADLRAPTVFWFNTTRKKVAPRAATSASERSSAAFRNGV